MARDINDNSTLPLIPERKSPGRPKTGRALSAAEKKRTQRAKDRLILEAGEPLDDVSTESISNHMNKAVTAGDIDTLNNCYGELLKRAEKKRDSLDD